MLYLTLALCQMETNIGQLSLSGEKHNNSYLSIRLYIYMGTICGSLWYQNEGGSDVIKMELDFNN